MLSRGSLICPETLDFASMFSKVHMLLVHCVPQTHQAILSQRFYTASKWAHASNTKRQDFQESPHPININAFPHFHLIVCTLRHLVLQIGVHLCYRTFVCFRALAVTIRASPQNLPSSEAFSHILT